MLRWQARTGQLNTPRGIAAVLMLAVYLFVGFAHGLSHLEIASPGEVAVGSVAPDGAGDPHDNGPTAGHHCHGCFAVAMPATAQPPQQAELPSLKWQLPPPQLTGQAPAIDTPPPKYLA